MEKCDIREATHVKVKNKIYKIKSKWGINEDGTLNPPSKGGFGIITDDDTKIGLYGERIDMFGIELYHKMKPLDVFIDQKWSRWPEGYWWGKPVWKKRGVTAGYEGPGFIRGFGYTSNYELRLLVGHVIQNGQGELHHIYSEGQLE
jgi:hypothetical protein